MKFPNAAKGVKKIFNAEIISLIAALIGGAGLIPGLIGASKETDESVGITLLTISGALLIVSGIALLIAGIMNIIGFIQAVDYVVPGFASNETLLYSPELKFYSNRVKMDTDFRTSIVGLYCLGDSSGWTRGLMMASVMGVLMGRKLLRDENGLV